MITSVTGQENGKITHEMINGVIGKGDRKGDRQTIYKVIGCKY